MSFHIKPAYEEKAHIKQLFDEYTKLLTDLSSEFKIYLKLQNYEDEVDNLDEKYGLPRGRLYIASVGSQPAGCIALRPLAEEQCEMKRLYVRPCFRGNGIAGSLVDIIIKEAKHIGYKHILLDTLPELTNAIRLYEKYGFYRIPPYNDSPVKNTVFMRLDL